MALTDIEPVADGLDFNLADPDNLADQRFFTSLARIRDHDPVFWSDFQGGWMLTRHGDVAAAFSDGRFSAKRLHIAQFSGIPEADRGRLIPNLIKFIPGWIINVDGDQHARLRRLVMRAFSRRIVDGLRPRVQAIVDSLLDEAAQEVEFDFMEQLGFRLPAIVIMELLGLPSEHLGSLRRWSREITTALASLNPATSTLLQAEACLSEMNQVFSAEFDKRRSHPTPDLLTELLNAREDRDALSADELLGMCHVLLIAGHDTTANSLGLGLLAWLANPEQRSIYLSDAQERSAAITEMLRFVAMSATQIRIVAQQVTMGGKTLMPGQVAFLMIAGANRDPEVFASPDDFDIGRATDQSMTFAPGLHHCVGHLLARMELEVFFSTFLRRFPHIQLVDRDLHFTANYAFRGVERLPIRLGPPR